MKSPLPTSPRSGRLRWRVCRLIALLIGFTLASTCLVLRGQSLRAIQPWAAAGSPHPQRAALLDQDAALSTTEDIADSTDASFSTFSALRRVISDDLSRLVPTCGGLSFPAAGGDAAAGDFAARHVEDRHGAVDSQLATVAASAGAWRWPGARDVSLANCQQNRRLTAELGSLLRSYLSMQARMRAGERADADGSCGSPQRDGGHSVLPAWARHSIVWYYSGRDTNGLGDSVKGMLSTVAASLLSPDPAPLYFAMQAAPDGSFPWVPSAAAGVDWRLPAAAQNAIASAANRLETVIAMKTPPKYHLSRGTTELQLPAGCDDASAGVSGSSQSRKVPSTRAATAPQLLVNPSLYGSRDPPAERRTAVANVTVLHIGARNNLKRRAGELLMRPLLQEAEEQAHSMRLLHTNELSGAFVDLQDWPAGRCPAEWYHGTRALKQGIDARGSWNTSDTHNGCLAHVPPEIHCYFLKTEVRRLKAVNESLLPPSLLTARDAACSWGGGDRVHHVDAATVEARLCPGTVNTLWYAGERALYALFEALVAPSEELVRRVLSAGRLGGPSVHVLLPNLLLSAAVSATPSTRGGDALAAAAAGSATMRAGDGPAGVSARKAEDPSIQRLDSQTDAVIAPGSVFQPGRQYVIGIHLRLGDEYFHRSGSAHPSSPTPAAADATMMQPAAVRARRAASAAVHCARLAAAELVARYGRRDNVVWVIAGDDPAGRDHLLRLAKTAAELGGSAAATDEQRGRSNDLFIIPPVVAVVSVCNETLHIAKQYLATALTDPTAPEASAPLSHASTSPPATASPQAPSTAARTRLFYDVYTEHALLSATHAVVKTHSGFSRTAALLGRVPLVLEVRSSAWNVTRPTQQHVHATEGEEALEWPAGTCIDSNEPELLNKTT